MKSAFACVSASMLNEDVSSVLDVFWLRVEGGQVAVEATETTGCRSGSCRAILAA